MKELYIKIRLILKEMRVWQWVKNFLVFAPLVFSSNAANPHLLMVALFAFISLCFASSGVYVLNDIADKEADRTHSVKKKRPIASGEISVKNGTFLGISLLILAGCIGVFVSSILTILVAIYALANILYSKTLKHQPILDILFVALLYLFRVYIGAFVINVPVSTWLFLTTFSASLFLVTGKRRAELVSAGKEEAIYSRKVLNDYNEKFLDHVVVSSLTLTVVFYSLYSILVHRSYFAVSIIFVVFGAFRYLFLVFAKNDGEEPEKILFHDKQILASGLLLAIYVLIVLYTHIL